MEKTRLFVDMDGTLAVFKPTKKLEDLYEPGYFRDLEPYTEVVSAIRSLIKENEYIDVYILSAYLSDSEFALEEKNAWLDKYLPEVDTDHRVFCHCGTDKKEAVPGGVLSTDRLLDDYTKNLKDWAPPGIGIKLINGINDTHKSWRGDRISRFQPPEDIVTCIASSIEISYRGFDESMSEFDPDPEIDDEMDL